MEKSQSRPGRRVHEWGLGTGRSAATEATSVKRDDITCGENVPIPQEAFWSLWQGEPEKGQGKSAGE